MAVVRPFRALRYDTARAGPLEHLVAPPYDVISSDARAAYRSRSPHNVVHLTLPDSEADAARLLAEWRRAGVLAEEPPAYWALEQDYVGPDGVARTRTGLAVSLRVEPYERRVVLPHERTHAGPKEGRLRLLRATRTQLEPIFLLYRGERPFDVPARAPDLGVEGTRAWRLADAGIAAAFAARQLLIADGHHRYETAVAFHDEDGGDDSAFTLAVLVSTDDPGLTIFPTHRLFAAEQLLSADGSRLDPQAAVAALASAPAGRAAAVQVTPAGAALILGDEGQLDVELVDRLGHEGIAYSPDREDVLRRVATGEAAVAYLVRAPAVEHVFAAAERGVVMPQKTTYFFPKLLSGLLMHPL